MKNLNSGDLIIQLEERGGKKFMSWLGKSREKNPGTELNPYFEEVITDFGNDELIVNFYKLEYMNSSTVPSIIKLFKLLEKSNISTIVQYNNESGWQRASFKALSTIAENLKNVTVEGIA